MNKLIKNMPPHFLIFVALLKIQYGLFSADTRHLC